MSSRTAPPPKSVLEIILEWSQQAQRPLWQQDALRRIVSVGRLSQTDLAALLEICKQSRADPASDIAAVALDASHLPAAPGAGQSVSLLAISGVEGVNQLAADQTLQFGSSGITIVYGDNGAGKSGYARILKKACRARHAGEIAPDAFSPTVATKTPAATIAHAVAGTPSTPVHWADTGKPHPILSAITVFDSDCADVHLREENDVTFRPFGLDIPDELARACQAIKEALSKEQDDLQRQHSPVFSKPTWQSTTTVGKLLSGLTDKTDLTPLEALASLEPSDHDRHRSLSEDLARDPLKAAAEKTAVADAVARLRGSLVAAVTANNDVSLNALKALSDEAQGKRTAAKLAAEKAFSGAILPGVGGNVWRTLWNAAKAYSEHVASVGTPYPPSAEGSPCVLCHQSLGSEALRRLQTFQEFVEADTEKQAAWAEAALSKSEAVFSKGHLSGRAFAADLRQVRLQDTGLARRVLRTLATARLRRRECSGSMRSDGPLSLTAFAENPVSDLTDLETRTRAYAQELTNAADIAGRRKLEAERAELTDRIALEALMPIAIGEVERLKKLSQVADCVKETATTAITHLGNEIADSAITPAIRDRFQDEIVRLAANKIRVGVVRSGGKFGSPQYKIRLFANPKAKVHTVLSEGEQTCVALAAFLTELATAPHDSALVFDDPVSSLDHRWRRQVAGRLVEEALTRQIIVFTHDLVFVNDLIQDALEHKVPHQTVTVVRGPKGTGIVSEGLPWVAAKVEDRLDKLEKDARAARKSFDDNDEESYRDQTSSFYDRLRSTWERAIEQVAFHHVVLRHRDFIDTRNLRKATVLADTDCDQFAAGYKKCCDQVSAHDPSSARNATCPAPDELLADVQKLKDWVKSLRDRQKVIS